MKKDDLLKLASAKYPEYYNRHQKELDLLIDQVLLEIKRLKSAAKLSKTPINLQEAKNYQAIWVISGVGTFSEPLTKLPGDMFYKNKKWAHGSDHTRIMQAIGIIRDISLILSGESNTRNLRKIHLSQNREKQLIGKYGPYMIYNGTPIQNHHLISAIKTGKLNFPLEKLYLPKGTITKTIDQVKKFSFPTNHKISKRHTIGIVTHVPHFPRLMRIINRYQTIPLGLTLRALPVSMHNLRDETDFLTGEIMGIIGYISRDEASIKPYPYLPPLDQNISQISLRTINKKDCKKIYYLFNDPEVRKNSLSSEKITFKNHKKWFLEKLDDQNYIFLIAESGDDFIGQIRFDVKNKTALTSISLHRQFRGKGLGKILLRLGLEYLKKNFPGIHLASGEIKSDNIAAIKNSEHAGFRFQKRKITETDDISYYLCDLKKDLPWNLRSAQN